MPTAHTPLSLLSCSLSLSPTTMTPTPFFPPCSISPACDYLSLSLSVTFSLMFHPFRPSAFVLSLSFALYLSLPVSLSVSFLSSFVSDHHICPCLSRSPFPPFLSLFVCLTLCVCVCAHSPTVSKVCVLPVATQS